MEGGPVFTRELRELRAADGALFGGKSASLGELLAAGIPVPPGFALSTAAFDAFVEQAGLAARITTALSTATDIETVAHAAHAIGESMRTAPVPTAVRDEIARRYRELARRTGDEAPPLAVRSSALGEDSSEATFAGQQDTYLWVRGVDDVCTAVRDCWTSLYSTEAISYRRQLGDRAGRPAMGVTAQLMVDAEISGVMFTCNPVSGDPSMIAINASWGLGLAVVGGEVTPDDYLVSKVTREVVREHINLKHVEYVPAPGGRGAIRVDVEPERQGAPCLGASERGALVTLGRRIERHFGGHQDVEWAVARGRGEAGLYVLQSRPVTTVAPTESVPAPASAMSLVMAQFGVARPTDQEKR